jgi:uncharacterized protein
VFFSSQLAILIAVFFLTSVLSVITGSTSLITVPVMIELGIEPHVAIATNLALMFMSVGGSLAFVRKRLVQRKLLPASILLTIVGSVLGALLLLETPSRALELVIALAMMAIAIFSLAKKDFGLEETAENVSRKKQLGGHAATFLLAIYGGLFSGGYVTLLTYSFVALFGMSLLQSVATTKVVNIFSSAAATCVFLRRGVVDYKLGTVLGITMFVGAVVGGRAALKLSPTWIRRIFVVAILVLAAKMAWSVFRS